MAIGTAIRRLLRRLLLWLATALEEDAPAPESATAGGPPAHWLERVRRDAPHLLEPEGKQALSQVHSQPLSQARSQPQGGPRFRAAASRPAPAAPSAPQPSRRRARTIVEEELVARRAPETHVRDGRSVPAADAAPLEAPRVADVAREAPLTLTLSPEGKGDWLTQERAPRRASPTPAAAAPPEAPHVAGVTRELPLTLTLSPEGRGDWFRRAPLAPAADATPPEAPHVASVPREPPLTLAARVRDAQMAPAEARHAPRGTFGLSVPIETSRAREIESRDAMRWPDLPALMAETGEQASPTPAELPRQASGDRWPELPPLPPFGHELLGAVESLDDAGRLRRIADEQRGSAWSE